MLSAQRARENACGSLDALLDAAEAADRGEVPEACATGPTFALYMDAALTSARMARAAEHGVVVPAPSAADDAPSDDEVDAFRDRVRPFVDAVRDACGPMDEDELCVSPVARHAALSLVFERAVTRPALLESVAPLRRAYPARSTSMAFIAHRFARPPGFQPLPADPRVDGGYALRLAHPSGAQLLVASQRLVSPHARRCSEVATLLPRLMGHASTADIVLDVEPREGLGEAWRNRMCARRGALGDLHIEAWVESANQPLVFVLVAPSERADTLIRAAAIASTSAWIRTNESARPAPLRDAVLAANRRAVANERPVPGAFFSRHGFRALSAWAGAYARVRSADFGRRDLRAARQVLLMQREDGLVSMLPDGALGGSWFGGVLAPAARVWGMQQDAAGSTEEALSLAALETEVGTTCATPVAPVLEVMRAANAETGVECRASALGEGRFLVHCGEGAGIEGLVGEIRTDACEVEFFRLVRGSDHVSTWVDVHPLDSDGRFGGLSIAAFAGEAGSADDELWRGGLRVSGSASNADAPNEVHAGAWVLGEPADVPAWTRGPRDHEAVPAGLSAPRRLEIGAAFTPVLRHGDTLIYSAQGEGSGASYLAVYDAARDRSRPVFARAAVNGADDLRIHDARAGRIIVSITVAGPDARRAVYDIDLDEGVARLAGFHRPMRVSEHPDDLSGYVGASLLSAEGDFRLDENNEIVPHDFLPSRR